MLNMLFFMLSLGIFEKKLFDATITGKPVFLSYKPFPLSIKPKTLYFWFPITNIHFLKNGFKSANFIFIGAVLYTKRIFTAPKGVNQNSTLNYFTNGLNTPFSVGSAVRCDAQRRRLRRRCFHLLDFRP